MNRRTFLRTAGLVGVAGVSGCSTPFDSITIPNPSDGSETNETQTSTPEPTPTPEPPRTRSGAALTGVYPGGSNLTSKLATYSNWLSQKPAVAVVFVDAFGSRAAKKGFIEGALTDIWKAGHVPLISWQPFARKKQTTSETIEREIARGNYDKQIRTWAKMLDNWARPRGEETRGRRFYFRPAHEMNGDWFPWSALDSSRIETNVTPAPNPNGGPNPASGTPEDYVGMWRQLHRIFSNTGMDETNIQWVWSPNADEIGGIQTERYYPGDEFVDWIGLDGFNFGGSQRYQTGRSNWRTPEQLFDPMLNRMRELTDKPVALTEFASSSAVYTGSEIEHRPQRKAQWIRNVFSYVKENDIKMTCWFDVNKTGSEESDWAVFGGNRGTSRVTIDGEQYPVYEDYKRTITADEYLTALSDYPPLLTDAEFAGQF
jgi:mannan endo-1,4-beta-mannosidase